VSFTVESPANEVRGLRRCTGRLYKGRSAEETFTFAVFVEFLYDHAGSNPEESNDVILGASM
jgi:hypothetical protein